VGIDHLGPGFVNLGISPSTANIDDIVTITFGTTEELGDTPQVRVNGNPAIQNLGTGKSSVYVYQYVVSPSDLTGPATISVTGIDIAGNQGSLTDNTSLSINATGNSLPVYPLPVVIVIIFSAGYICVRLRSSKFQK